MAETNSVARPTSSWGITHAAIRNPRRPATELKTEVSVRASESPSSRRPLLVEETEVEGGHRRDATAAPREPLGIRLRLEIWSRGGVETVVDSAAGSMAAGPAAEMMRPPPQGCCGGGLGCAPCRCA
ncbi:hypothetical protein DMP15_27555 [Pseudonocardia sp. UM4_GMWB1]